MYVSYNVFKHWTAVQYDTRSIERGCVLLYPVVLLYCMIAATLPGECMHQWSCGPLAHFQENETRCVSQSSSTSTPSHFLVHRMNSPPTSCVPVGALTG